MHTRILQLVVLAAVAAAALVLAGGAAATTGSFTVHTTMLSGFEEVDAAGNPGQGDLDAFGAAVILVNTADNVVCWVLSVHNTEPILAAHIHIGAARVNGPVVVPLSPTGALGFSTGCTVTEHADAIAANPSGYYVNVHNAPFPAGAARGQLS